MIVASNLQGLGNRIKCIMGAARIDPNYLIRWPSSSWVQKNTNSSFLDIFDMSEKYTDVIPAGGEEYRNCYLAELPEDRNLYKLPRQKFSRWGGYLDGGYETIPDEIRREYTDILRNIKFTSYINENVKNFSKLLDDTTIGVQIRSWPECKPHTSYCNDRHKMFDLKYFAHAMQKYQNCNFFVSCDDPVLTERLKNIFGDRIILYKHEHDNEKFIGERLDMRTWVSDVLILAKCNKLLVSPYSTFAEIAWWFGGANTDVEIIGKSL